MIPATDEPAPLLAQEPETPAPKDSWRHRLFRYGVLLLVLPVTFGTYFVYDLPGALSPPRVQDWFGVSPFQYELLYSLYSWPSVPMALCGGLLVDRVLGLRWGCVLAAAIVTVGQAVYAIGTQARWFELAVLGRIIFGLGGESAYAARWFLGKELSFAFALTVSFSRVGSAFNFNISPYMADNYGEAAAVWLGCGVCAASVVLAAVLAFADWTGSRRGLRPGSTRTATPTEAPQPRRSAMLMAKAFVADMRQFRGAVWVVISIVVSYYIGVFIFITIASGLLMQRWGLSDAAAGSLVSIPYALAAVVAPFVGVGVDIVGCNLVWMLGSCVTLAVVQALFAFTLAPPALGMVLMGLSYSVLAAALWPCLALLVPRHLHATAYGLAYSLQNLGLAIAPMIVGAMLAANGDVYKDPVIFFMACALLAAVLTGILLAADWRSGSGLNRARCRCLPGHRAPPADGEDDEVAALLSGARSAPAYDGGRSDLLGDGTGVS